MDPFKWQRANTWDDKEIRDLFVPPSVYEEMQRKAHHVLLGNAASGKTMVLRSLAFSAQWEEGGELPRYIGVYIPLTEGMLAPFKEAYRESTKWEVFGHYFNLVVAEGICNLIENYLLSYISEEEMLVQNLLPIFNLEGTTATFHQFRERLVKMQKQVCDFVNREITLGKDTFPGQCTDILVTIKQICKEMRNYLTKILGRDIRFYLLIDGYERLKELAVVVNALLEDENCEDFCMKIATTRIVDLLPQAVRGVEPKAGRDYQIASLEHTEPLAYQLFLKKVTAKRLEVARKEKPAPKLLTDIEQLLSSEPSQVEKQETGYLDIGPLERLQKIGVYISDAQAAKDCIWLLKLKRLREKEKESKDESKSRRKNLYYSFPLFASLSSGVVTNFLRLCSKAFELAERKKIKVWEGDPIPSDIEGEAALTVAREAFDDIVSTSGEYGGSLANFVYNFAEEIEGNLDDKALGLERTDCLGIEISDIENLASDPKLVEMVKRGLQESILLTKGRMDLEMAGMLPAKFSINAIYSPRFGISYRQKYYLPVQAQAIANWVAKDVPGRPSSPFKMLPTEPEAPRMLENIPIGFLAVSFREQDKKTREVIKREFRKAIHEIIQQGESSGKGISVEEAFFDAEDVAILGGLEEKSLAGLKKAPFCVAELSTLRPNVFMELGMAMALKKQYYMIWDVGRRDFNPDLLPDYLQNLEIVTRDLSQWKERRRLVQRILRDFQNQPGMLCPLHKDKRCNCEPVKQKESYFFLYYNQEKQGYGKIFENLAKMLSQTCGIDPIPKEEQQKPHRLCRICYSVQRAKYCLVDTTEPSYSSAFVWGFAFAHAPDRPLLDVYCRDKGGLPSMLKGHPSYGWDPSKRGEDILQAFRENVYSS